MIRFAADRPVDSARFSHAEIRPHPEGAREFLVGPENPLVPAVVAAVATFCREEAGSRGPAPSWLNPLVVAAPAGCGKTHLVRGLASLMSAVWSAPGEVITTTAVDFASQYLAAAGEDALEPLRQQIRRARLWAVEDIGRLPRRETVQTEFLHTLDEQVRGGTLVVATACRPPQQLTNLSAALRSRLEGGLVLTLAPPSVAVRREMLRRAAAAQGVPMDAHQIDVLATRLPATPRQLLGIVQQERLSRLTEDEGPAAPRANGKAGSPATASPVTARKIKTADILAVTARYFGVTQTSMKSASRKRSIVHARSVAMYLARELGGATLQDIGTTLGGRDHTTVLHACRKIDAAAARHSAINDELSDLRRLLMAM
jgi:chromosomal replication initiator protein